MLVTDAKRASYLPMPVSPLCPIVEFFLTSHPSIPTPMHPSADHHPSSQPPSPTVINHNLVPFSDPETPPPTKQEQPDKKNTHVQ
ncbi:hypothetical protein EJ06DRAFT_532465 [Trichodelitschia bisporula]|uniref:Uncharacterized protein n=1 Tax=Trichodelitschia bisporula TaxID=703511 RepID=A0A6G1HQ07_9PEZI|nr:hypothetical protein EJ06DRAFT_532465 [Trichodelitschia bisporula]